MNNLMAKFWSRLDASLFSLCVNSPPTTPLLLPLVSIDKHKEDFFFNFFRREIAKKKTFSFFPLCRYRIFKGIMQFLPPRDKNLKINE